MPCDDGGVPFPPTREEVLNAKAPAMLCAVFAALSDIYDANTIINSINEAESGVTKAELLEWYVMHRRQDAARRIREEQSRKLRDAEEGVGKADAG